MKLFYTLLIFLLVQNNALSQDIYSYPLPKSSTVEYTYSGSFKDSLSFHFLSIKSQKQAILLPFIVDKNNEVEKLAFISFDKPQKFIGHFCDEKNYYLVTSNKSGKEAFLTKINIDTKESKISTIDDYNKRDSKFILNDKMNFINVSNDKVSFKTISAKGNSTKTINIDKKNTGLSGFLSSDTDYIDETKYVKWGSLKTKKVYQIDDIIYFTYDGVLQSYTKVYSINLKEDTPEINKFKVENTIKNIRDYNSYAFENLLFTIGSSKEEFILEIVNLKDGSLVNKISSQEDYFSKDSYKLESFLKNAKRSYNDLTISANKTVDGNYLLRIEAINENYNYYNGWWTHYQFMQNIINQNSLQPKFTPNPDYYEASNLIYNDDNYYEFVINENGEILKKANSKIIFDLYDTAYYLSKLKDNRKFENLTGDTTGSNFYAIGFDKKAKEVKILKKTTLNY